MFLKWIYNRNKRKFWDMLVADFYGEIPQHIKSPALEFLQNARPTLERFFSIEAYQMQRRSISDAKNAQVYQGILLHIRVLLAIITKGKIESAPEIIADKKVIKSPSEWVKDFVEAATKKKDD